jgi:hypothetical protein
MSSGSDGQSSLIAPSSRASASSGALSPRNTAYPLVAR